MTERKLSEDMFAFAREFEGEHERTGADLGYRCEALEQRADAAEARVKEVESLLLAKTKTMTAHIDARLTEERLKFEALQELDEVRATLVQRDEALARVRDVIDSVPRFIGVEGAVKFYHDMKEALASAPAPERSGEACESWAEATSRKAGPNPERSGEARFEDCDHCTYPAYHERVCLKREPAPEPAPKAEPNRAWEERFEERVTAPKAEAAAPTPLEQLSNAALKKIRQAKP